MASTHITDERKRVFETLESGEYGNFALFSCFVNGEPAVAIAAVLPTPPEAPDDEPGYLVRPLFVSVTPTMRLTDHDPRFRGGRPGAA